MKTELVEVSPTRKEIKIEIDADAVRGAYDRVSDRYAKQATVPGFRKGHAPRAVVRTRFKDDIRGEVLRELIPNAVNTAIQENSLYVLGEPDVHLDNSEGLDKFGDLPLTVHAHVEVLPEVQLGEYKGIEATRMLRPVTDADVDRVIDGLRESAASLLPVEDRGAETGDTVTVNFEGVFVNEPEAEHIKVDEVDVEVGGSNVQKEFTENLTGVRPDEERVFTVIYPEDFTSKGLAGKEVEYTAKVTAVRRKDVPEVDDEFAKSLGEEFDSVAALRDKVREDLAARSKAESDNRLRNDIIGKLVEAHQFEVPASLVESQADHHLESVVRDMFSRGVDPRTQEFNWDGVREQLKGQAMNDIRASLLLEAIAEDEKIDVSDEEIQVEIDALAASSRQTEEQVRAALTKQGGERSIADRLRNRKALDLLVENARVTDEEWREVEEEASAPSETEESVSSGEETDQSEAQTERHNAAAESGNA